MDWYAFVERHFKANRYDESDIDTFVLAGKITEEEANQIKASKNPEQ